MCNWKKPSDELPPPNPYYPPSSKEVVVYVAVQGGPFIGYYHFESRAWYLTGSTLPHDMTRNVDVEWWMPADRPQ